MHRTFIEFVSALVAGHQPERTLLGRRDGAGRPMWHVRCPSCDPHRWQVWAEGDPAVECRFWVEARARGLVAEPVATGPGCSACTLTGVCSCVAGGPKVVC